ncbi:necrosis inducing protein-domain-containing protein [Aspergillus foveolatus]|uniref:necrosis inducing protein-domain-containing protein n=1 Tax=Aspergillus foveolatus TaxID=210207 RepID=UPI003CCD4894
MLFLSLSKLALFIPLLGTCLAELLTPFSDTASDLAIKFQPVLDFDTDSCYQTAAIGKDYKVNSGIDPPLAPPRPPGPGSIIRAATDDNQVVFAANASDSEIGIRSGGPYAPSGCRDKARLDHSQTYVLIFVSWSAHGDYTTHYWSTLRFEGSHPMIVYHLGSSGTHSLRKAEAKDDEIENDTGRWFRAPLVSLEKMPCKFNQKLLNNNWGSAHSDLSRFGEKLDKWMPWDARNNEHFDPWEPKVPSWAVRE